ncbi:hypothetical protein BKG94_06865 [Rodentibacter ratti]|uniref:hypothetical protein n=1 Tax=Rodentibacter ratti TaxID=1906745 RepID=UPI000986D13E|nr:hypothetical protein [Rodentibacter ratti]OOF88475.1 hypothetical protein BKG94_06865 [Rodentibacter ratti]
MNKQDAITFLKKYQPLPDDEKLTEEIINKYDEIRKFFIDNPDDDVIGLFLNSYGNGDGLGVYPLVEDVLLNCSKEKVILSIKEVLEDINPPNNVRYWVTQNAELFFDDRLRKGLEISLHSKNEDIRDAATIILDNYQSIHT